MRNYGLPILAILILGTASGSKKDAGKTDISMFQGTWVLDFVEINGEIWSPDQIGECLWISKEGEVVCKDNKKDDDSHYNYKEAIDRKLVFSGCKCTSEWKLDGRDMKTEDDYEIDVSKNPKQINFPCPPQKVSHQAENKSEGGYIYSLTNDELRFCWSVGETARGFDTKNNKKRCLLVYKRQKKQ